MQNINMLVEVLKQGKLAVIPTDTIYGIVAQALNKEAVERLYQIRRKTPSKPFIILISAIDDLEKFDIQLNGYQRNVLEKIWPNPISVVLPCNSPDLTYLHRDTNSLAFRLPINEFLIQLIQHVGPLVAPSANLEGEPPAETIEEARHYFGNDVEVYIDEGTIKSQASTLISLANNQLTILRKGSLLEFVIDIQSSSKKENDNNNSVKTMEVGS
jgi:L-threonylcarbamoyladenylate synthase